MTEGLFFTEILLLQSLRLATRATSLYTREAYCRQTVHLKGVTHYTLQARRVKRSTNKSSVLLLIFRQIKPALWKAPSRVPFSVFSTCIHLLQIQLSAPIQCAFFRTFNRTFTECSPTRVKIKKILGKEFDHEI